jgi:hypothetical protein
VTTLGTEIIGTGASMPNKSRDFYLQNTLKAFGDHTATYSRPGESFRGHVLKLSINFDNIPLRAHGNFEELNKVLDSSIKSY